MAGKGAVLHGPAILHARTDRKSGYRITFHESAAAAAAAGAHPFFSRSAAGQHYHDNSSPVRQARPVSNVLRSFLIRLLKGAHLSRAIESRSVCSTIKIPTQPRT